MFTINVHHFKHTEMKEFSAIDSITAMTAWLISGTVTDIILTYPKLKSTNRLIEFPYKYPSQNTQFIES